MNALRNLRGPIARRHPLTGQPIEPLGIVGNRVVWPILGGDGSNDGGGDGSGGGSGSGGSGDSGGQGGGSGSGSAGQGSGSGSASGSGSGSGGTGGGDGGQGGDPGFPRNTPLTDMTVEQREAYWKHQARKHENTWKGIAGDRSPEDVRKDIEEYQRIQQEKLTPSEKAIAEAEQRGRKAATVETSTKAATAILRANLQAQGLKDDGDDKALSDLVDTLNVAKFIDDSGDIDTDAIANFAKRFATADTATQRRRDFGAGDRRQGGDTRGARGKAEAQRRFEKKQKTPASS